MRRLVVPLVALGGWWLMPWAEARPAGKSVIERLTAYLAQTQGVFQPASPEPTPPVGAFLSKYMGEDPGRVGTFQPATSSCSALVRYKDVRNKDGSVFEARSELFMLEVGIGAQFGVEGIDVGASYGRKSVAAIDYSVDAKRIVDPASLEEVERCCIESPTFCTGEWIAEWWHGSGEIYRMINDSAKIAATVKYLELAGKIDFSILEKMTHGGASGDSDAGCSALGDGTSKHNLDFCMSRGFSVQAQWRDSWFAYRSEAKRFPSCEEYTNRNPAQPDVVRFTGVSALHPNEQRARVDARDDARHQLVSYIGAHYVLQQHQVVSMADAVISGLSDDFTCVERREESAGPMYLARARMYALRPRIDAALAQVQSGLQPTQKAGSP